MTRESGDRTTRGETCGEWSARGVRGPRVKKMIRNRKWAALALFAPALGAYAVGCGDDEVFRATDAGSFDVGPLPDVAQPGDSGGDGGPTGLGCGDSKGAPPRMLLSINNKTTSELAAFNLADKKVDGRFTYDSFIGLTSSMGSDPYLLQQEKDVVARLDPQKPWQVVSTWSVRGDDARDGGMPNANPASIVVPSCSKGYVLRYNRNKIAVIDTNKAADAGAPESFLDLSPLLQAGDKDGLVEMTAAVYAKSKNRIYVLLGNIDFTKIAADGFTALCADTKPTIVGIDATTGQLVSLGGTGPGGSIQLAGYNPPLGTPLWYDAARERLLVMHAGCNTDTGGGVAGPIERRRVEEVDLATGQVKTLLSLDDKGFPSGMLYVDGSRAALAFFGEAYFWNPAEPTLGPAIPGGFDLFAHDGKNNAVGVRATYLGDGGKGPIEVVSVPFPAADAGEAGVDAAAVTKLGENPFTDNTGFTSGVEVWPHP